MTSTTKILVWILGIVIVLGAVWYFYRGSVGYAPTTSSTPSPAFQSSAVPPIDGNASILSGGTKTTDIQKDLDVPVSGDLNADLNQLDASVKSF